MCKEERQQRGEKVSFLISKRERGELFVVATRPAQGANATRVKSLNPLGILILNKEREEHVKASSKKKCEFSPLSPCFFFA